MSPIIDMAGVEEAQGFTVLPAGAYICTIKDVTEKYGESSGNKYWEVAFVVTEGDFCGATIKDGWHFTESTKPRMKLICSRLGFDTSGTVDLSKKRVMGLKCTLIIKQETYSKMDGTEGLQNKVEFGGYEFAPGVEKNSIAGTLMTLEQMQGGDTLPDPNDDLLF